MDFFYYNNNSEKVKLNIKIGSSWNELNIQNAQLNSIFSKIDDGDGNVSADELTLLQNLFNRADSIMHKFTSGNKILENEELDEVIDLIDKGKIKLSKNDGGFKSLPEDIKSLENPLDFLSEYKTKFGGKTLYSGLLELYKKGEISLDEFLDNLTILSDKFNDFEENFVDKYEKSDSDADKNRFMRYGINYDRVAIALNDYLERQEHFNNYISDGEFTREEIDYLKQYIKTEFNCDLTDNAVAEFIISVAKGKCGIYDEDFNYKGLDLEKVKDLCKSGRVYGETFPDYLKNILCYDSNGYNDTLEHIDKYAQIIESEYERYNYELKNSDIADLLKMSNAQIEIDEQQININKTPDSITLFNKQTNETRSIDINKITENLDEHSKNSVISALNGMNKTVLWEFALEVKVIKDDACHDSGGQYFIEDDHVGINNKTTKYSLIHEMCHAMMATVIDGKNTFNEDLYEEFVETYKAERAEYSSKGLLKFSAEGYNYCAANIKEFAAEAGCLYLTGESVSEFTIAKHFPKSYRLYVSLAKKIQGQSENRSVV